MRLLGILLIGAITFVVFLFRSFALFSTELISSRKKVTTDYSLQQTPGFKSKKPLPSLVVRNGTQTALKRNIVGKIKLTAYERSLLEKKEKRMAFLHRWINAQDEMRLYPTNQTKYIIFNPSTSGLGNTLAVLAEAIVLSWVTNRRLLIYNYASFRHYFSLPLNNYYENSSNLPVRGVLQANMICKLPSEQLLSNSMKYFVIQSTCKFIDFFTSAERFRDFLGINGFIINPRLRDGNDIRKTVYHFIYSEVIRIHPDVLKLVEKEKQRLHWSEFYWIGVQIRSGHMPGDESLNTFILRGDLEMFSLYAEQQTAIARNKTAKSIKWFIAADSQEIRDQMQIKHSEYAVSTTCEIRHSFRDMARDGRSDEMMCTLLDNYLLSNCNELIITAKSTYGILASFRNPSIKKLLVYRGDWRKRNGRKQRMPKSSHEKQ